MTTTLSKTLSKAATVDLYDDTEGIFGELIHPSVVVSSLERGIDNRNLVGRVDEASTAADGVPAAPMKSLKFNPLPNSTGEDIGIEIENTSDRTLRVRWLDTEGSSPPSHIWTVLPMSSFVQSTRAGHLFVMSAVSKNESDLFDLAEEEVLGAYRPIRELPSVSPHCILIQQQQSSEGYLVEALLLDETKKDALVVASSALDPISSGGCQKRTIATLKTIVTNILTNPEEAKYRTLRLSNQKIQRDICTSWGGMQILQALGFYSSSQPIVDHASHDSQSSSNKLSPSEEYLHLAQPLHSNTAQVTRFVYARELLQLLEARADPHFVAELALPTPWQKPLPVSSSSRGWHTEGTQFITDEERWARTERMSERRRRGYGRPPPPGEAPSSRGAWGR